MSKLENYRDVAPRGFIELLYKLAEPLQGKTILHINSTKSGGGVAEILHRMLPLFLDLGIQARWEVISGDPRFFGITKKMHNALQGMEIALSDADFAYYRKRAEENISALNLDADLVIVHDPQPLPLIAARRENPWIWRCHIDLSSPHPPIFRRLAPLICQYQGAIISMASFSQSLSIPEYVIPPSIDPLSPKNCELSEKDVAQILQRLGIQQDLPLVLQVSRFDWFKDPLGVLEAYRLVLRYEPCQLVLVGGPADDDPEGQVVYNLVRERAKPLRQVHVLLLPPDSHREINALQRAASVVVQKSTREGFGLTVSEALWKEKAVVGGACGGIPQQLLYGASGFTVNSIEGCAYRIRQLLANPAQAKTLGQNGKELVRQRFLITRHLADYLVLMRKCCL